jgi:uncharacterized protein (DUF58 family)
MKKTARFIFISALLTGGALVSVVVSIVAMQTGNAEMTSIGSRSALLFAVGMMIYILPRLARNIHFEALRSDLSFKFSTGGWIFLVLLLVVALLAFGTANNLLYLVLALLASTLVVSEVASRLSLNKVDVKLRFPDHIFAREGAHFEITVRNRKRVLPSFSVTISAAPRRGAAEDEAHIDRLAFFAVIPSDAYARARIEIEFPRRGVYPVRGFTISTRFPFGFIERRRHAAASGEVVVYPQPQPLDELLRQISITQGQTESLMRGSSSDLYSIRQYYSTDHPRHIDWKATAKTTRLMVREFTRDDDWRMTIVLDPTRPPKSVTSPPAGSQEDEARAFAQMFENAMTMTASLAAHFIDAGADVRLIIGDDDLGYGRGRSHCYFMLGRLARLQPANADAGWPSEYLNELPALASDKEFKILITPARREEIPPRALRATELFTFADLTNDADSLTSRQTKSPTEMTTETPVHLKMTTEVGAGD